jgi:hypothetical protein
VITQTPQAILEQAVQRALDHLNQTLISDEAAAHRVELICRNEQNKGGIRFILACALAKAHNPLVDIRKPYTEIGGDGTFSGRRYDETYIESFIRKYSLPSNSTTAFLTPAWRNINRILTPDMTIAGRPPQLYAACLQLLTDVYDGHITADDLLTETIRRLIMIRNEQAARMDSLLTSLKVSQGEIVLSAEQIVTLIRQHMASPRTSRLPVLVVAAVYNVASVYLGEQALTLEGHNAADSQTHALGDVMITLSDEQHIITAYEVKMRRVTINDIDHALSKIQKAELRIENFIFITTDVIEEEVIRYCAALYEKTQGIEVVVLDCLGFLRHFLHLFHRVRMQFLDAYQTLVLAEPDSAVGQPLKETFLTLRRAAEAVD